MNCLKKVLCLGTIHLGQSLRSTGNQRNIEKSIIIIIIMFNMTSDKTQMKLQSVEWKLWKLVSKCLYTKVV